MKNVIVALDADSTKIGMTVLDLEIGKLISSDILSSNLGGFDRTYDIFKQLKNLIESAQVRICGVIIEDYGFYKVQRYANQKAELVGIVKYYLRAKRIPVFLYLNVTSKSKKTFVTECSCAPTQLKKFITGSGKGTGSGKSSSLMLEVYKITGHEFKTDDQADSYMLALMYYVFLHSYKNKLFKYSEYKEKPAYFVNAKNERIPLVLNKDKFEPIEKWIKGQNVK